ncbi:spore germination protein [Desulfallas thermosapovorans]|uniref:Spore germination protein KA n=1 Tax=Desulfallas thermosapovorans DSM 6562 TaxID=1121431 RepID=A0A5S4ZX93_9FIRM|nr:spore germination protein [Desulfallas thermosapovorans]TYO97303.1 spore germination protein KA [Desulfallas thermosapovorans DSM 6562]
MAAFFSKIRRPRRLNAAKKPGQPGHQNSRPGNSGQGYPGLTLSTGIEDNLRNLKEIFSNCDDIVMREFLFAQREQIKLALIYIDGLTDKNLVSDQIMRALSLEVPVATNKTAITKENAWHYIKMRGLCAHQIQETQQPEELINAILSGDCVLLVDGHARALIIGSRAWAARSIGESKTETVIRGPRESFVETLRTNTSMLRRKIKNPNLKIETLQLGEVTKTDIAVIYLKGIAKQELVQEVKKRLAGIKIDAVLESGYIEELIQDHPYSVFPTLAHTDRPDRVAAHLLEGRVAIMVDGTPVVLVAPYLFIETIQTPEDYYERSFFMSGVRMLRIFCLLIALTLPSFYIAIVSFHHEMLPTPLLLSIAAQREAVPFPVFAEALIMELAFEIIREAGIRLPRDVGQAVSLVAALIIGQAAVQAGLVAGATIIVVALTAMASFTVYYSSSITFRLLRFPLMFLGASFGLFGLVAGIIVIVVHMASLRSFGVPYLAPLGPIIAENLKDTAIRVPWWAMNKRPYFTGQNNPRREAPGMKSPSPQPNNE